MEEKDGKYEKLLAGVIAARATSFLFNKLLLAIVQVLGNNLLINVRADAVIVNQNLRHYSDNLTARGFDSSSK